MEDILIYNELIQKLRAFFLRRNFIEVPTQSNLSILAACENPHSIVKYFFDGKEWPMIQTGQMVLEEVLLKNPNWDGVFCVTTSYRDEKNPIPGRHAKVFPMFEFESKGTFEDLKKIEKELLEYLGFKTPLEVSYDDMCKKYGISIVEHEHETQMWSNLGPSISLQKFPKRTSPFFNMKTEDGEIFEKIDVILYGMETIGSAVRSSDPITMRKMFYEISEGEYAGKLFELFGKERVEKELEEFLKLTFIPRYGAGIGMTRLMRAYKLSKE